MVRAQGPQGIRTREELKALVVSKGTGSARENEQVFDKWFADAPRRSFRIAARRHGLTDKLVCDVGCAYGMNLPFCAPGSYGIEIDPEKARFGQALGLTIHQRDAVAEELGDLPRVDAVWCCDVLPHVDSPHVLLRKLHLLLKPDGLLFLYSPTMPLMPWLRHLPRIGRYFHGWEAADHVSAYTPATLEFAAARAGFRTVEMTPLLPFPLSLIPGSGGLVDGCLYVGRKIEGWDYPAKATRSVPTEGPGDARRQSR